MMYFLCPAIALELVLSQKPMFGESKVFNVTCTLLLSRVRLFETPWTVSCQAPLSMGFPKKEYWGGLPFPTPALPISFCTLTKTYLIQKFARYNWLKYQWLRLWLFGELYLVSSGTNYPDLHPYSWGYLFISKFLVHVTKDFPHILVTMIGTGVGLSGLQVFAIYLIT